MTSGRTRGSIVIAPSSLDERVSLAGRLINLLAESSGDASDLVVNQNWFSNPFGPSNIGGVGQRPEQLLDLLAAVVGDPVKQSPTADSVWYPIKFGDKDTGLCLVLPMDHGADPAVLALGIFFRTPEAGASAGPSSDGPPEIVTTACFLFPFFSLSKTEQWRFVLGQGEHPVRVVGQVQTSQAFKAGDASYQVLRIVGDLLLDGTAPNFSVDFLDGSARPVLPSYTTLEAFLASQARDWIDVVLALKPVAGWLDTKIGSSTTESVARVLAAAHLLVAPEQDGGSYKVADLSFKGQSPLGIAQSIAKEALDILATQKGPLVKVGADGGIWAVKQGTSARYGIRLCMTDVGKSRGEKAAEGTETAAVTTEAIEAIEAAAAVPAVPTDGDAKDESKNKPEMLLQIGKWFSGEKTATDSWLKRADGTLGGDDPPEPGVYVFLLQDDDGAIAFKPRLQLVSVGLDYVGGNESPLIDVKGVKLGGFEPRLFLEMDLEGAGPSNVRFGAGVRLDQLALPMGGGFDGVGGDNKVAANLLASGSSAQDKGGDAAKDKTDAVNPGFSVSASYVSELNVQLYGADDGRTDRIWVPVQRSFGPLHCTKLGVGWDQPHLSLMFEGGVAVGPLDVELSGLSLGLDVSRPTDRSAYALGLEGLSVDYKAGSFEISGGFLENKKIDPVAYDGEAFVKAGPFGISAIGSYSTLKRISNETTGATSLFVFALLNYPLGGPGFFFITGLAGGFGYNRSIKVPDLDEVHLFPLVQLLNGSPLKAPTDAKPAEVLAEMLSRLDEWIPPTRGQNWIAAGLKFTTFDLVYSNALIVVSFGNQLEIDLLGTSSIQLPPAVDLSKAFAYAELDLEVVIAPDEGVFKASLVLGSESFVLDRKCRLTGGFAFYAWFGSNAHAGDFVVTLGGYHAAFTPPDYYPIIARLGFDWPITTELTITGGSYFALTPACAMGGGRLELLFQSGGLKVWFIAHADFIIFWKPFFFDAGIGVSVGVSYTFSMFGSKVTLAVELGAELELWGPPTGGLIRVSLFIISFTIGFGEDKPSMLPTLSWDDFKKMLPQGPGMVAGGGTTNNEGEAAIEPKVLSINVASGLLKQDGGDGPWIVRPDEFEWFTKTTVPASQVVLNGGPPCTSAKDGSAATTQVGVRPMGITSVSAGGHAIQVVKLKDDTNEHDVPVAPETFDFDLDLGSVPEAMWGAPVALCDLKPTANLVANCIVGVARIRLRTHGSLVGTPVIDVASAFTFLSLNDPDKPAWLPISVGDAVPPAAAIGPGALDAVHSTLVQTSSARSRLFAALAGLGLDAGTDGPLTYFAANPGVGLGGAPLSGVLVEVPA